MVKHTLKIKRRHSSNSDSRKTRSDKKIDIRVPISDDDREFIMWNARSKRQSMTSFATEIVRDYVERNLPFKEYPYKKYFYEVHIKVDQELYQQIVNYSIEWNSSIRETAYRILVNSLYYIRGGVHIESIQRTQSHPERNDV